MVNNLKRFRIKNKKICLTHILLIIVSLVWIYPFIWMVSASFKTDDEIFAKGLNLIPKNFNFDNFIRAWNNANFEAYFFNSIVVTVCTVLLVLILSAMMGYVMGRYEFKGKKVVLGIFLASMVIPLGFTIIPIYQAIKALGLMNTRIGLILAESGGSHIIFILLFAGFFKEIPKSLEEAAIMDGCGFLRIFINIMLPLSKPIIGSVVIMQFIWTWNSFLLPLVLTLSNEGLRTLAVGLYAFKGEYVVDWTGIAAGGTISLIPIIIVFVVLQKYFVEGIAGSIKG